MSKLIVANKKAKTTKSARRWTENKLELFVEVLADPENNFAISLEKLALRKPVNNEVFEYIKNNFDMKMDNKIFRQNNADQVKNKATKLEQTNYGKIQLVLLLSFKNF